jgi:hypothetical protein
MANKRGARKAPELSPEAIAANAAADAMREKEKQDRKRNAEKQKRFRESMKESGFKRVTLWGLPCPADKRLSGAGFRQVPAWEMPEEKTWDRTQKNAEKSRAVKVKLAVNIRETSLNVASRSPEVKKALASAAEEFLKVIGDAPEVKAVYADYLELVAPLGDPWGAE